MNELSVIGNNLVGRMYRPHKMLNSEKRGFIFYTKYKSNFGGELRNLILEFNLEYDIKDSTEIIKIDIKPEEKLKVMVKDSDFNVINKITVKENIEDKKVKGVRTIVKPDTYNITKRGIPARIKCSKGILFVDLFIDSEVEGENEIINLAIYPSIIENIEYLIFEGNSITPIIVKCEKGVKVI